MPWRAATAMTPRRDGARQRQRRALRRRRQRCGRLLRSHGGPVAHDRRRGQRRRNRRGRQHRARHRRRDGRQRQRHGRRLRLRRHARRRPGQRQRQRGAGADTISGSAGNNIVDGGPGDDPIDPGAGDDTARAARAPTRSTSGYGIWARRRRRRSDVVDGGDGLTLPPMPAARYRSTSRWTTWQRWSGGRTRQHQLHDRDDRRQPGERRAGRRQARHHDRWPR